SYTMKTFKLKSLAIFDDKEKSSNKRDIPLLDGLVINREDDKSQWIIEAFCEKSLEDYFRSLENIGEAIVLETKISKESNLPAYFTTSIISVNEVEEDINVLFIGTIVNQAKNKTE